MATVTRKGNIYTVTAEEGEFANENYWESVEIPQT